MIKILCIGNSFSQDSTTYLQDLAYTGGIDTKIVNLYIGGCSLERHWNNVMGNKADYEYQLNGLGTGKYVTIKEVLEEECWDIITMQQCSGLSGLPGTYHPYINELSAYVSKYAPKAKQFIHQTWAYEIDSDHPQFELYHKSQEEMYQALRECYSTVARELSLDIIPFGEVIQKLRTIPDFDYKNGGKSLCRDGFRMHYLYGRYALAVTWYEYVLKGNILFNEYLPPIEEEASVNKNEFQIIKECIHHMANSK